MTATDILAQQLATVALKAGLDRAAQLLAQLDADSRAAAADSPDDYDPLCHAHYLDGVTDAIQALVSAGADDPLLYADDIPG